MLFLLIPHVFPHIFNLSVSTSIPVIRFPHFGFQQNGQFLLYSKIPKNSNFVLVLITNDELRKQRYSYEIRNDICTGHFPDNPAILIFPIHNTDEINLNISIPETAVYTPYLFSCDSSDFSFKIGIQARNPDTYTDYRDRSIVTLYRILSFIHFCFFIVWVINAIRFIHCYVRLHTNFTLLPCIKSVSLYFWAGYAMKQEVMELPDYPDSFSFHLLDYLYQFLMLVTFAFALGGYSTFRESFLKGEQVMIPVVCLCIVIAANLLFILENSVVKLILAFILGMLVLYYLFMFLNYSVLQRRILEESKSKILREKVRLARMMGGYSLLTLIATALVCFFFIMLGASRSLVIFVQEMGFVIVEIFTMKLFLFRKEYFQAPTCKEEMKKQSHPAPVVIVNPNGKKRILLT